MSKNNEIPGLVTGLVSLITVACFLLLGFTVGRWELIWLILLIIPVTAIIVDIVTKNKDFSGAIVGIVSILAAVIFCLLGFIAHLWFIAWTVFLAIPVTAVIIDAVKKKDLSGGIMALISILCVAAYILLGFCLGLWHPGWMIFMIIPITAIIINIIKAAQKGSAE